MEQPGLQVKGSTQNDKEKNTIKQTERSKRKVAFLTFLEDGQKLRKAHRPPRHFHFSCCRNISSNGETCTLVQDIALSEDCSVMRQNLWLQKIKKIKKKGGEWHCSEEKSSTDNYYFNRKSFTAPCMQGFHKSVGRIITSVATVSILSRTLHNLSLPFCVNSLPS